MAITTKSELQTAVAAWLIRGDLTARIPEFITLAEARLNRVIKARQAEADQALTGVVGARVIALPATFIEAKACWITPSGATQRDPLRFVDAALLNTISDEGRPLSWTIDGANLAFERPCDQAYSFTLRMVAKYQLTDASPTNDLLTCAPDVYLFATLAEAGPFVRNAELATAYEAKAARAIAEFNELFHRNRKQATLPAEPAAVLQGRSGFNILTGH